MSLTLSFPSSARSRRSKRRIWLTEVAQTACAEAKGFLDHLKDLNHNTNLEIIRLALKFATGTCNFFFQMFLSAFPV
jgi:hypothetical protein